MKKYIDKDFLWDELQHTPFYNNSDKSSVEDMMLSIPTADVVHVVHGKWIVVNAFDTDPYQCTICGNSVNTFGYNFCPNCGAKMDGELC